MSRYAVASFTHRRDYVQCLCLVCVDCRRKSSAIFRRLCNAVDQRQSLAEKDAAEKEISRLLDDKENTDGHVTVEAPGGDSPPGRYRPPGEDSPPGFGPLSDFKPPDRRCVRVDLGVCAVYHDTHFQCFQVEFRRLAAYFPSLFSERLKTRMGERQVPVM